MTRRPGLTGVDVLVALLLIAGLVVAAGALFLRALDHELDEQDPPTNVTPSQETHTP